ncbi:MAG: hypothetical protein ACRD3W_16605, partial [Terriglobales bacterium]
PLILLPVLAIALFFIIPRAGNGLDAAFAAAQNMFQPPAPKYSSADSAPRSRYNPEDKKKDKKKEKMFEKKSEQAKKTAKEKKVEQPKPGKAGKKKEVKQQPSKKAEEDKGKKEPAKIKKEPAKPKESEKHKEPEKKKEPEKPKEPPPARGEGMSVEPQTPQSHEGDKGKPSVDQLLLTEITNRPTYLRQYCFDHFDGKAWTRSEAALKAKTVDAATTVDTSTQPVQPPPIPAQQAQLTPQQFGGNAPIVSPQNQMGRRINISVAHSQDPAPFTPPPAAPTPQAVPQHGLTSFSVALQQANAPTNQGDINNQSRNFVTMRFDQGDKGKFNINKAPALRISKYIRGFDSPVSLKVEAADFGKVLCTTWIPKEIICTSAKKLTVDPFGNVITGEPMKKGSKYSVTAKVAVYN